MNHTRILLALALLIPAVFCNAETTEKATTKLSKYVARPNAVVTLDEASFAERIYNQNANPNEWVYAGDKPCIIDFYTTWCGPCKRLAPVLEELAEKYSGLIYIYRIDAEKELNLSRAFGIRSYPSLLFCPMSGKPQMAVGALPKMELEQLISQILLK